MSLKVRPAGDFGSISNCWKGLQYLNQRDEIESDLRSGLFKASQQNRFEEKILTILSKLYRYSFMCIFLGYTIVKLDILKNLSAYKRI